MDLITHLSIATGFCLAPITHLFLVICRQRHFLECWRLMPFSQTSVFISPKIFRLFLVSLVCLDVLVNIPVFLPLKKYTIFLLDVLLRILHCIWHSLAVVDIWLDVQLNIFQGWSKCRILHYIFHSKFIVQRWKSRLAQIVIFIPFARPVWLRLGLTVTIFKEF